MDQRSELDNPVWHALTTVHASLARGSGLARRYAGDVSPLVGLAQADAAGFADLRRVVEAGEVVALFTTSALKIPKAWQVVRAQTINQMVCAARPALPAMATVPLSARDVPEMLALTAATVPGPFLPETIQMGRYFGIRSAEGRLAAMAGQRLRMTGYEEVSAVCTDAAFRGRGYAQALVTYVAGLSFDEGKVAFLHVKTDNAAKRVYERIGFRIRRAIHVTVVTRFNRGGLSRRFSDAPS